MGRQVDWSLVPDIEYLGPRSDQMVVATVYANGKITIDDQRMVPHEDE